MVDESRPGVQRVGTDDLKHSVIELRSDNAAAAAPAMIDAIAAANVGSALAYGADEITAQLVDLVGNVFEHDRAHVFPVTSGTAANGLGLSAMTPSWGAVWCHRSAHIITNECGATSMLSGGAVMRGIDGPRQQIDADILRTELAAVRWGDNHQSQPAVLSLTQPTDLGTVYPVSVIGDLSRAAAEAGMRTHLDGARLANAVAALGCNPADLTHRAGINTFTLGATKNGAVSAEAIVTFDDDVADQLVYRTKRAGHVSSKMRFQSAQLIAYLTDGYWLGLASAANERMAQLWTGIAPLSCEGFDPHEPPDANMIFIRASDQIVDRLTESGLLFYRMGDSVRFVTNWSTSHADIEAAIERITAAVIA